MTWMRGATLFFIGATVVSSSACAGTVSLAAEGETPRLAAIEPGVWVVEGHSEPVFYSGGYYWRYSRDNWYRSQYLGAGWRYTPAPGVPRALRRIERPGRYAGYRAPRGTTVRPVPREDLRYYERRTGDRYAPRHDRRYEGPYGEPRYGRTPPRDPRAYDERYDALERYDERGARRIEEQQRRDAYETRRELEERRREIEQLQRLEREREAYRRELERRGY